jgi:hypothetical protein
MSDELSGKVAIVPVPHRESGVRLSLLSQKLFARVGLGTFKYGAFEVSLSG